MEHYSNTFIIKQIPTVGTCVCPECEGAIEYELRKFYNIEKKYNFIYHGYKNHVYKISKNGIFSVTR